MERGGEMDVEVSKKTKKMDVEVSKKTKKTRKIYERNVAKSERD